LANNKSEASQISLVKKTKSDDGRNGIGYRQVKVNIEHIDFEQMKRVKKVTVGVIEREGFPILESGKVAGKTNK
jgi:hypothetical protein